MALIYTGEQRDKLRDYISEDLYVRQRSSRHVCVPVGDGAYFIAFFRCDVTNLKKVEERVCLFCSKDGLIFFGDSPHCIEILRAQPKDSSPFLALSEFFFSLTAGDIDTLDSLETEISELENELLASKSAVKGGNYRIISMRRGLLKMKRYYEQLGNIADRLVENENHSITEDELSRFHALGRRVDRLTESVLHLREFITQVREAYQAQIDIEQNQIMKVLTVLTSVFLPLTLIVGWYGMNYQMPEYSWKYGYVFVICLSVAVCVLCVLLFKRKKWY